MEDDITSLYREVTQPGSDTRSAHGDDSPLMTRAHGAEMSMEQFGDWVESRLGTTIQGALEQAAFMLCCDVISQDIAKSTLRLRERTGPSTSRIVQPNEHPIAEMLALEPNSRHTWAEYTEMAIYWGAVTSNALSYVKRNRFGDPIELIPLQTGRVRDLVAGTEVFYDITASTQQERALFGFTSARVPESDIVHVRSRMLDGMSGYSTLQAGRKTLDVGRAIEGYRSNLFEEDGSVRGVFTRKTAGGELSEVAFERLRNQFRLLMNKYRKLTEPIVLEGDWNFESTSSRPDEVELTKQFAAQVNATCRLLRVPPHKVFQMDGVKYENLETSEKMYVGDTLVPVCHRHEQRLSKTLLSRKDRVNLFFEWDRDEMTIRDPQRLTERNVRALERGAITFDEFRAREGENPLPNEQGEHRMVPANMSIIDSEGNVVLGGISTPSTEEGNKSNSLSDDKGKKPDLRVVGE